MHVWGSEDNFGGLSLVFSCVEPGSLFLFALLHIVCSMLSSYAKFWTIVSNSHRCSGITDLLHCIWLRYVSSSVELRPPDECNTRLYPFSHLSSLESSALNRIFMFLWFLLGVLPAVSQFLKFKENHLSIQDYIIKDNFFVGMWQTDLTGCNHKAIVFFYHYPFTTAPRV